MVSEPRDPPVPDGVDITTPVSVCVSFLQCTVPSVFNFNYDGVRPLWFLTVVGVLHSSLHTLYKRKTREVYFDWDVCGEIKSEDRRSRHSLI